MMGVREVMFQLVDDGSEEGEGRGEGCWWVLFSFFSFSFFFCDRRLET